MTEWAGIVGAIMGCVSTIVCAWFAYNQKTKDKMTDLKIQQIKDADKRKAKRRADHSVRVIEELRDILHELECCRAYIVQPHPLGNEEMLTIYFEVKRKGVEAMKPQVQHLKISEVAKFAGALERNLFTVITNIEEQVKDRYAQSIFASLGTSQVIIKRLSDAKHDWVGSIICEYTNQNEINQEEARKILHNAATNIQYILPEIEE